MAVIDTQKRRFVTLKELHKGITQSVNALHKYQVAFDNKYAERPQLGINAIIDDLRAINAERQQIYGRIEAEFIPESRRLLSPLEWERKTREIWKKFERLMDRCCPIGCELETGWQREVLFELDTLVADALKKHQPKERSQRAKDAELENIRARVREVAKSSQRKGSELCSALDVHKVPLPPTATWRTNKTWRDAYLANGNAVGRWLYGTLNPKR